MGKGPRAGTSTAAEQSLLVAEGSATRPRHLPVDQDDRQARGHARSSSRSIASSSTKGGFVTMPDPRPSASPLAAARWPSD